MAAELASDRTASGLKPIVVLNTSTEFSSGAGSTAIAAASIACCSDSATPGSFCSHARISTRPTPSPTNETHKEQELAAGEDDAPPLPLARAGLLATLDEVLLAAQQPNLGNLEARDAARALGRWRKRRDARHGRERRTCTGEVACIRLCACARGDLEDRRAGEGEVEGCGVLGRAGVSDR